MNLLLVPVCDNGILCFSPTPAGMGQMQVRERVLAVPLLLGLRAFPESCELLAAALQDVTAGAASPAQHHVEGILVSQSARCSAFRFAFILVGHKLKVGSVEQLLFVAV